MTTDYRWYVLNAKLVNKRPVFKYIHSRSKNVQNQWNPCTSRSLSFPTVQRFYGRTTIKIR